MLTIIFTSFSPPNRIGNCGLDIAWNSCITQDLHCHITQEVLVFCGLSHLRLIIEHRRLWFQIITGTRLFIFPSCFSCRVLWFFIESRNCHLSLFSIILHSSANFRVSLKRRDSASVISYSYLSFGYLSKNLHFVCPVLCIMQILLLIVTTLFLFFPLLKF